MPQKELDYEKLGVTPPEHLEHGTDEDIRKNMQKLLPTKWRQEGNLLIGETEMGEVVNHLPTDMILVGTDDRNLPILKKVV